jgi:hypothetical protein
MDQSDFLQPPSQSHYAELCTALYERELFQLSHNGPDNVRFLKRRLGSLPFYVKRAAHALCRFQGPLLLDVQNAGWQASQKREAPAVAHDTQKLQRWLKMHAELGLVLPVQWQQQVQTAVFLDSVDECAEDGVHLNRFGWFDWQGRGLDEQEALLLKPDSRSMTAACCGHQWSPQGRIPPRTLGLREVLLAATLSWPRFTRVQSLPD